MNIKFIRTTMEQLHTNGSEAMLVAVVDEETEIKVLGYGSAGQTIKVRSYSRDYDPEATLANAIQLAGRLDPDADQRFWGTALVYAEPLTLIHAVMNVISNS